jgi:hypothetical protein
MYIICINTQCYYFRVNFPDNYCTILLGIISSSYGIFHQISASTVDFRIYRYLIYYLNLIIMFNAYTYLMSFLRENDP